jgi:hypothetical protein
MTTKYQDMPSAMNLIILCRCSALFLENHFEAIGKNIRLWEYERLLAAMAGLGTATAPTPPMAFNHASDINTPNSTFNDVGNNQTNTYNIYNVYSPASAPEHDPAVFRQPGAGLRRYPEILSSDRHSAPQTGLHTILLSVSSSKSCNH